MPTQLYKITTELQYLSGIKEDTTYERHEIGKQPKVGDVPLDLAIAMSIFRGEAGKNLPLPVITQVLEMAPEGAEL